MNVQSLLCAAALLSMIAVPAARADESALALKPGAERELVSARCVICHSVDYIIMNSPIQGRAGWETTVNKMVKVMKAPITPEELTAIVRYLDANYGAPGTAPSPAR